MLYPLSYNHTHGESYACGLIKFSTVPKKFAIELYEVAYREFSCTKEIMQILLESMKRKFLKKRIYFVVSIAVVLVMPVPFANAGPPIPDTTSALGLQLRENFDVGLQPATIFGSLNNYGQETMRFCASFDTEYCLKAPYISLNHNWDVCTEKSQLDCISQVWAVDPAGKRIEGELIRSAPADKTYDYAENLAMNLPSSRGMGGIWKFPGVVNSAGKETYFVSMQSNLYMTKPANTSATQGTFTSSNERAAIVGIEETRGSFQPQRPDDVSLGGRGPGRSGTDRLPDGTLCVAAETNLCQKVVSLPENYRFGMTLKFSKKINGWFHGRFFQPSIQIDSWKSGNIISIEAAPVKVPSLDFIVPRSEIVDPVKKLIFNGKEWGQAGSPETGIRVTEELAGPQIFDLIKLFAPMYKDKATTTDTSWSFKTLNYQGNNSVSTCTQNSSALAGLVTTNALGYSPGAPSFNTTTGTLEYQVASPHLEANGQVASGTYDLAIKSEVARCIYNFSNAPIKAEVSITGDDGEKRVATTVVNERDGWLYMSAKGFTFSAPKIQVKLSQDAAAKVAEAIPSAPATPAAKSETAAPKVVLAKKSITCVKGKSIKKVTGTSPKCPTGFKKR